MANRTGQQSYVFERPAGLLSFAACAGPEEKKGPLGQAFDETFGDLMMGEKSFELAERMLMEHACSGALKKAGLGAEDVALFLSGDLLNQNITGNFTALRLGIPFFGLYNACSSSAEMLLMAAFLLETAGPTPILAAVSSHFCTAERQYRYPTEYGVKRKPFQQRTATGAAAFVLTRETCPLCITGGTVGILQDYGVRDPLNMGKAMAPAAAHTLLSHFADTGLTPGDYDLIMTGDLGAYGQDILREILKAEGLPPLKNLSDGGLMLFDRQTQDVSSGGSGCACGALGLCGRVLPDLLAGRLRRVLYVATGALMSPTSVMQKESIPCIAHALVLERKEV